MKYTVTVKEVWVRSYEVEAVNQSAAIEKVYREDENIKYIEDSFELDHVTNPENWEVIKV